MKIHKYKLILKERWKFYLIGYLIAYFIPILMYGTPNWQYLFPIRLLGIVGALGIGTALFYGSKKMPVFEILSRSLKYALIIIGVMLLTFIFKEIILSLFGVDITPFIGIQQPKN